MFEDGIEGSAVSVDDVHSMAAALARAGRGLDDAARIDMLRALEVLACTARGAQARVTADFDQSQRAEQARAGVPAERVGQGIAAQVALARRESPHRGQRHLGLARVLADEMPHTRVALATGRITEWKATVLARETACLSRADRAHVDRELAGDLDALEAMGDRQLYARTRSLADELDPVAAIERRRRAESERRVTLRPAPDTMSQLTGLLPVKDGVAVWAVLSREADRLRSMGDSRSRGQIMADTLVARVLDPGAGSTSASSPVRLMINVAVPDSVLLGDDDGCGWAEHYGPVPGDLLREWIADNAAAGVDQWVRRLYVAPQTGELITMDSKARRFEGGLADYLRLRDQSCATRYCDAPVRHLDHVKAHADGGATSPHNGQGVCEACNYTKQAHGWSARPRPGPRHTVETITPTGHRYSGTAPAWTVAERGLAISLGAWVLTS
jgi:uncharacterized protein DUF222/HNH endonuclease